MNSLVCDSCSDVECQGKVEDSLKVFIGRKTWFSRGIEEEEEEESRGGMEACICHAILFFFQHQQSLLYLDPSLPYARDQATREWS